MRPRASRIVTTSPLASVGRKPRLWRRDVRAAEIHRVGDPSCPGNPGGGRKAPLTTGRMAENGRCRRLRLAWDRNRLPNAEADPPTGSAGPVSAKPAEQVGHGGGFVFELGDVRADPLLSVLVVVEVLDDRPGPAVLGADGEAEDQAARDAVAAIGDDGDAETMLVRGGGRQRPNGRDDRLRGRAGRGAAARLDKFPAAI